MKKRNGFTVMSKLIGLVRPLAGYMLLAIIMGLLGHLAASFITIFGGFAVLDLLGQNGGIKTGTVFVCVGVFALVRGILRYAEQSCNHFIAFKLLALIRDKVFRALRRLAPAKLEGRDKGDLISVITSDIELLEVFYAHTISPAAIAALFTLILCLFIGHYHWALGLLALAAYAVVGLVIPIVTSRRSGDLGLRFRNESGALSAFLLDSLRGLPEIQQYGRGEDRLAELNRRTDSLAADESAMKKVTGENQAITGFTILFFDLCMLGLSALLYVQGRIPFAGTLIPTMALMSSFGPAVALANLGATLQNTFAAGNRVLDILEEGPSVADVTGEKPIGFTGAAGEDITFSYGGETVVDGVSVKIPEHSVIGISGRSGSGKSTLLKLFLRFWETQKGQVTISGREIGHVNTENLRRMESFVTQETHLFHDSIRSNLMLANPKATEEDMIAACKKASVHDFIMGLPQGYDTPVGELGDTLSGGERQRLGLARAFLHDAPFLLLDEPTSNLDSLNEAVILRSIGEERGHKTVVLVSHRPGTMRFADRVYSVEHGRLS